jgi:1-acyl-sn-glycerol-3-phosphate acyltransferase
LINSLGGDVMKATNDRKQDLLIQAGNVIIGGYARLFLDFSVMKIQPIPPGPKLFACNHPTTTDPFLIELLCKEPVRVLITSGAFQVPAFREFLLGSGHIPVNRGEGKGEAIIGQAVEALNQGKAVCIFPEGVLSPEESNGFGLAPAHSGVGRIALASGVPVIPVGIAVDKNSIITVTKEFSFTDGPAIGRWAAGGSYVMTVGRPLSFSGDPQDRAQVQDVGEQITKELRRLVDMSRKRVRSPRVGGASLIKTWNFLFSFLKKVAV